MGAELGRQPGGGAGGLVARAGAPGCHPGSGSPASPTPPTRPAKSRRYGGIHFEDGDLTGRSVGHQIGGAVWTKALSYFNGTAS
jgi:hypothetical protein